MRPNIRIGIVAPDFPPDMGGMQAYALEVSLELVRRGFEVIVLTKPHAAGELQNVPFKIFPLLTERYHHDRHLYKLFGVDMWHVMTAGYSWWASSGLPTFVSIHGNDFLGPIPVSHRLWLRERFHFPAGDSLDFKLGVLLTRRLVRKGFRATTHVFANSNYSKMEFLKRFPDCVARISTAYVGVSSYYFERGLPQMSPAQKRRIVSVSRLAEPRKNIEGVLRALALLKDDYDFHYTIIGDGHLRASLVSLADTLGLRDRCSFLGQVDREVLRNQLSGGDLFVLAPTIQPGSFEGFGISYLEANACGVPSLGTRLAGAAEAINEGVSGYFSDGPEPSQISNALRLFLSHRVSFEPQQVRAHAARFLWPNIVDHLLEAYSRSAL